MIIHLHMVKCETIAVTDKQAESLRAAARVRLKCARSRGAKHLTFGDYFKGVRGKVPNRTDADTTCAEHRLVRVAIGLRQKADITHESKGNVHFKKGTALAKAHPAGVRCYAPPALDPAGGTYPDIQDQMQDEHTAQNNVNMADMEYNIAKQELQAHDDWDGWDSATIPQQTARRKERRRIDAFVDGYRVKLERAQTAHFHAGNRLWKHQMGLRAINRPLF